MTSRSCENDQVDESLRLYVCEFDRSTMTPQIMEEYFSRFGSVRSVDIMWDIAFVEMATFADVEAVLDRIPHQINGKEIIVRLALPRNIRYALLFKTDKLKVYY